MRTSHDETVGRVCEVLSHPTRRAVLRVLRGAGTTTVERVASQLVDGRDGRTDGADVDGDRRRIAVALHHVHLPKLAAAGVVDYDPVAGTVATDSTAGVAYELLRGLAVPGTG